MHKEHQILIQEHQVPYQQEPNTNISAVDRQVWSEIVATSSSSERPTGTQGTYRLPQQEGIADRRLDGTGSADDLKRALNRAHRQGSSATGLADDSAGNASQPHLKMDSDYGARPPSSLPRDGSRTGSRSLANLNAKMAAAAHSQPQTLPNGQSTLETDNRAAAEGTAEAQSALPLGRQASTHGLGLGGMGPQQFPSQRDKLKQREDDLEARYRQLQDYAQAQIGSVTENVAASSATLGEFGKETESEREPPTGFSKTQQAEPNQGAWHPKKAWARPASAQLSQTERPAQTPAPADEMSCSQQTHTMRLNQLIHQDKAQHDARSELHVLREGTVGSRQVQIEHWNGVSHSQTEAEQQDPGIGYDKSHGDGPAGLHLLSGSNACSQSQQSQSKNLQQDSARDLQGQASLHPFGQPDRHNRTIESTNQHDAEGHWRSQAQKESDKMQTGSFKAKGDGLESSLSNMADMKNVTAMLFRAMNYKYEEGNEATVAEKKAGDGRNDKQSHFGTRETQQSKTTEVTQMLGPSQSNTQVLDQAGVEAALFSGSRQAESKPDLHAQREETGEQRLQQELERIQNQKKLISSYLPKDYEYRKEPAPLSPTLAAIPEQTGRKEEGRERGHSNSSFGKAYNFGMNLSSKFGRNLQEQLDCSKSPRRDLTHGLTQHSSQLYARRSGSREFGHLTGGQDGHGTSKDYRSALDGQNPSNGPVTVSSNFVLRAGDKELPREVFNYRDLSQDASRRSRAGLQATDRPISYPTNMTNMTHDQIVVSPESSSQAQKRSSAADQAPLSNNEMSNRGLSWRADKLQFQPPLGAATASEAHTSQERYAPGKQEIYSQHEQLVRSRSREPDVQRVDSPSAKRRQGLSPYSKSSRHRGLQNSGLALLKKTTALLKHPPAVSNYKALNFDQGLDQEQESELAQQRESQKALESNASRKGVILSLYRKNSGAGTLHDKDSEYRRQHDYAYQHATDQSHERKQGAHQASLLDKNAELRAHYMQQRATGARVSPQFDSGKYTSVPPRALNISRERSGSRGRLPKSGSSDRAGIQSQGGHRTQGKLTLGFLRRLNRNHGRAPSEKKRSTTDEKSDRRRSSQRSFKRSQKDNDGRGPNLVNVNGSQEKIEDDDTGARTSSRAGTDAANDSTCPGRSATSKINRYKKFERELEQHKAALEAIDQRKKDQQREAAAAEKAQDAEHRQSTAEKQAGKEHADHQQTVRDLELRNQLLLEELRLKNLNEAKEKHPTDHKQHAHYAQRSGHEFSSTPEQPQRNPRAASPHRTLDSHRGSNFTLGNQRTGGEPSPPDPTTQAHGRPVASAWADCSQPQRRGAYEDHHGSGANGQVPPRGHAAYSGSYLLPQNSAQQQPRLNYNYFPGPGGARAELNCGQGLVPAAGAALESLEKRAQSISYMMTTYNEDDSMQQHNRTELQEEMPSQIHGSHPAAGVGAHLASEDSFGRRRYSVEHYGRPARHQQNALPEENLQHLDISRARSQAHARHHREQQPAKPVTLLDQYLQKNEELRQQQASHARQGDGLRTLSPALSNDNCSRSNLSRQDLIPCRGPPSRPQNGARQTSYTTGPTGQTVPTSNNDGDQGRARRIEQLRQNQELLQRKAQELRDASFERPRYRDQYSSGRQGNHEQHAWHETQEEGSGHMEGRRQSAYAGGFQEQRREPSPASLACMPMKSSFGKKMKEQVEHEQRCSAKKPPLFNHNNEQKQLGGPSFERDQYGARARNHEERDGWEPGSQHEVCHQGESFRPPGVHQESPAYRANNVFTAGAIDPRSRSSEQAQSRRMGGARRSLEQPAPDAMNSSMFAQTQMDRQPSGRSPTQTLDSRASQTNLHNYQQSIQHRSNYFMNASSTQSMVPLQNMADAHHPNERRRQVQGQDAAHFAQSQPEQYQQSRWAEGAHGLRPEDHPSHAQTAEGCGTPHLPGALTPEAEGRLSTMKMLNSGESYLKPYPQAESGATLGNRSQTKSSGLDGPLLPIAQMSYGEGAASGHSLPEHCHHPAEQLIEQTIGTIIRSPEIEVTSKDLALDQMQTATLSKHQEPSLAGTKSSHRRSGPINEARESATADSFAGGSSEQGDIKKLIRLQFEQARMLMDLQKQFLHCQEFERAAQLESMDQSLSRNYQDEGMTSSSKRPSSIEPDDDTSQQPVEAPSAAALRQCATSTRPGQGEVDSMYGEAALASRNQASYEPCQRLGGRAEAATVAGHHGHTYSQPCPDALLRATTPQATSGQSEQAQRKKLKHVNVKSREAAASCSLKPDEPAQASGKKVTGLHPSASQAVPNANPLTKHKSTKRSAAAKRTTGPLSHQSRESSLAIPNLQAMQSNRSLQSAASKQSQAHLSHISQRKASTMALIQKIYQQMEKIDNQISHKERVDEERYNDMERRMRKLYKKYNKVKQENEKLHVESSQLLSLQPTQRVQVRSLAVEAGPTSCDFERVKKSTSKTKSSKMTSATKGRHKSKVELGKGSLLSESKPLSSVEATDRTLRSVIQDGGQRQPQRENGRSEIQIVEHDSQLDHQVDRGDFRVINNSSALSQSYGAQAETPGLETKITQVNELLADEPLRPSDCMSASQQEVQVDFHQQFPSAKRSLGATDLSGASSALARSEATICGQQNPSFGAQFPSAHDASPRADEAKRPAEGPKEAGTTAAGATGKRTTKSGAAADSHDKSQAQRSLPSFSHHIELSKQSNDTTSLKINSVPSQSSHVAPQPTQPPMSQAAQSKGSSRLLSRTNVVAGSSSRTLRPHPPSAKLAPTAAPRQDQGIFKEKGIEILEDADPAATCSSGYAEKEAVVLLGSTIGMAEETLQIQAERRPAEPAEAEETRAAALQEVKALTSNQNELENQVHIMNGAIAQLRAEHQSQIETMKSYYQEQINQIREEVQKRDRSQSRGRAGLSSGMGTPAAALQNRMKSLSNENILNLTNLSMSASEQKLPPSHHHGSLNAPSPSHVRPHLATTASQQRTQAAGTQKVAETEKPEAQAQEQAEQALSKLMDQRKFTDTIEQLNKAVGQKEKLEQKLLRIKEKIKMAKNIKSQQRERSKDQEHCDSQAGRPLGGAQIVSREAEVHSTIEQDDDGFRGTEADKAKQFKGMFGDDELAGLSGVTLSDLPARTREANEESTVPMQSTRRDDTGRQEQELDGPLNHSMMREQLHLHERQNAVGSLGASSGQVNMTAQALPPMSGPLAEAREATPALLMTGSNRHSSGPTAEFALGQGGSQTSMGVPAEGSRGMMNHMAHTNEKQSFVESRQQFEYGLNYNYIPSDLMHANMGNRGHAAIQSHESQAIPASNYSAASARETKSETTGRGATRPVVSPYTGGERFLQPFIPGSASPAYEPREAANTFTNSMQNAPSQQQLPATTFHHSTALAPGLILLEQHSQPPQAEQLHTIQQTTQEPIEGLSEVYLRDTTQQTAAGGSHHNAHSTLESTSQRQIMQDSRRGIYQKIIGLQSLQNQQRSPFSQSQYGPTLQRNFEPNYAVQPGQQVFVSQQSPQPMGTGLGAPTPMVPAGGALAYSMPGARMATITEANQAPTFMYRQDQPEAAHGQGTALTGLHDRRDASPLRRAEQPVQRVDDLRAQLPHGHLPQKISPYPASAMVAQNPMYLQARPVLAQPLQKPLETTNLFMPTAQPRHVGQVAQPVLATAPMQVPGLLPVQAMPPSRPPPSHHAVLQPRFPSQPGTLDNARQGRNEEVEQSENDASYTMHSSSIEGTSRSEHTSATSDATSSCPYSERSISQAQESDLASLQVQVQHPHHPRPADAINPRQVPNPFTHTMPNHHR